MKPYPQQALSVWTMDNREESFLITILFLYWRILLSVLFLLIAMQMISVGYLFTYINKLLIDLYHVCFYRFWLKMFLLALYSKICWKTLNCLIIFIYHGLREDVSTRSVQIKNLNAKYFFEVQFYFGNVSWD